MKTILLQTSTTQLLTAGLILLLGLIIFLILRAVMLWYWKVDVIVGNQEKQLEQARNNAKYLRMLIELQGGNPDIAINRNVDPIEAAKKREHSKI